jgi:hypothetical protein
MSDGTGSTVSEDGTERMQSYLRRVSVSSKVFRRLECHYSRLTEMGNIILRDAEESTDEM